MSKPSGILTVPYFDTLDPFNLEEAIKDPISYMEDRIDKMFEDAWTLMTFKRLWKQARDIDVKKPYTGERLQKK